VVLFGQSRKRKWQNEMGGMTGGRRETWKRSPRVGSERDWCHEKAENYNNDGQSCFQEGQCSPSSLLDVTVWGWGTGPEDRSLYLRAVLLALFIYAWLMGSVNLVVSARCLFISFNLHAIPGRWVHGRPQFIAVCRALEEAPRGLNQVLHPA